MKLKRRDELPPPPFRAIIEALNACRLLPATPQKRFIRDMRERDPKDLTERQRGYLLTLAWTYRRQLPAYLVPAREPVPIPPRPRVPPVSNPMRAALRALAAQRSDDDGWPLHGGLPAGVPKGTAAALVKRGLAEQRFPPGVSACQANQVRHRATAAGLREAAGP